METPEPGTSRQLNGRIKQQAFSGSKLLILLLLLFLAGLAPILYSQPILRSTIRGTVTDRSTQSPLAGATIILLNSDPLVGTTTDADGNFKLSNVPIGKRQLKVTYVGYSSFITDMLNVSSGKETMVVIPLEETMITGAEVEIKGDYRKYGAINKMAMVSVRSFTVDETSRFAGSYNDPARMAANYAGVTSGVDNRNDIIVRGNSPVGLQWQIDGMEIPNPNHFAAVGTTGGPVTILNNNLLTNSDFFTGAFPASYGNALSGVFDLRMRIGNNEKHEYWFGIGWNGLEFGSEGPFSKKSRASYLFSYRYSLLDVLSRTGIKLNVVPYYQDLNFKITVPTKKAGVFTIEGIGGLSFIQLFDNRKKQSEWMFPDYGEDLSNGSNLGVIGITNQVFPDPSLRLKNQIYFVASEVYTKIDSFSNVASIPSPWAGERSSEKKLSYSFGLYKKFSVKNSLETGINADYFSMYFADSVMMKGKFVMNTDSRETLYFLKGYLQWQHRFSDRFRITTGLFGSRLFLNSTWAMEPRIGLEWLIDKGHILHFGTGMYSQMQPRVIYFILTHLPDGSTRQTNRNLDFTRCWQVAMDYNYLLSEILHFKTELYYQHLYDVPVKRSIPSYALSNQGHEFFLDRQYADSLVNLGKGDNYGVEFTFERFLYKNYYFLLTSSLFNSTYSGYDNTTRNSAFNVNYAFNAVGGYEFIMGKRKWGVMSFGLRATWAGGNPYIPFDVNATVATGEAVPDWQHAYQSRYPDYKRLSVRFGIKRNRPGYNLEFMLDLQYRTNYTNVYLQRIDPKTGEIRNFFKMGFFPMATWRVQF
ncbi:MAG TPA: TonB-dependent receptor [Bacteroidales bacterium]|nr:TonB-dependent receptor [Bacteroidales bacterium]